MNYSKLILFSLILVGTISFNSCKNKKKETEKNVTSDLLIDKIVVKDTIFVIDTICPPVQLNHINDSLMFLYIKQRNERVINRIKANKGIIFTQNEIDTYKNK